MNLIKVPAENVTTIQTEIYIVIFSYKAYFPQDQFVPTRCCTSLSVKTLFVVLKFKCVCASHIGARS